MGYDTSFNGYLDPDPALTDDQIAYLQAFNQTARTTLKPEAEQLDDPVRKAVGLPFGKYGDFCVVPLPANSPEDRQYRLDWQPPGQPIPPAWMKQPTVSVGYGPGDPRIQPNQWCQWTADEDGSIVWDEGNMFYDYEDWLRYLQTQILSRWGVRLTGTVSYFGEDPEDFGVIVAYKGEIRRISAAPMVNAAVDRVVAQIRAGMERQ